MSHGPTSYLRIKKGLQGKYEGHGCWLNGFVKPTGKIQKRRAAKKVRHKQDISNGSEFRKAWGYWEWC